MMNALVTKLSRSAALGDEDRRVLEALCGGHRYAVARNRDVVREGEQSDYVHVLLEGWAARYKVFTNGTRQITAFLLPGDLCDLEATVLQHLDHSVTALTPVKVAAVPRDRLIEVTRARSTLAQAFWWATMVDAAVSRAWIVNIGRRDAYARIAHLACELHARMSAIGLATDRSIELPLTQDEIGDALGLTSVHINRSLKRLRDEGLMEVQQRTLTILDAEQLTKAAGFEPTYLHRTTASRYADYALLCSEKEA